VNKFLATLFLTLSLSAHATEMINIDGLVCYPTKSVESWTYVASGNTVNGVRDSKAYLEVQFAAASVNGTIKQSTVRYKVDGLTWDKNFKRVIYTKSAAPVVCAKKYTLGGLKLFSEDCNFKASFDEATVDQMSACGDEVVAASTFEGIFVVF
jgi:hypothetical protein